MADFVYHVIVSCKRPITPLLHPFTVAHNTCLITPGHLVATSSILRDNGVFKLFLVNLFELKSLLNRVEDRAHKLKEAVVDGVKRATRFRDKV